MNSDNVFNRILLGQIPCEEVYSDEYCLAFRDVQPQAPVHILVIPRKSIESLQAAEETDKEVTRVNVKKTYFINRLRLNFVKLQTYIVIYILC